MAGKPGLAFLPGVLRLPGALLLVWVSVGVALGVTACGDRGAGEFGEVRERVVPEEERYGGTIVVASGSDIETFNSLVSTDYTASQYQKFVLFAPLVRLDAGFAPQPYVASSWEFNSDTSQILMHLRDDVRWHDGTPVTSDDVVFTFALAKNPLVPFPNVSYFDYWDAAEAVDAHTVRFTIRPHNEPLLGWAQTALLPAHILRGTPPEELAVHPFGTVSPVGNGPFRFVDRSADSWVFEANPDFPEALGGRPYADRLVHRVIAEPGTRVAELQTGGVDMVVELAPAMLEGLEGKAQITVSGYAAPEYVFIAWNSRRPFFQDVSVRRALTLAIDRPAMVRSLRAGHGSVASGPIGPWHWAYDSTWAPLPYSADSAGTLLAGAGWVDTDGDGLRDRNGQPFRFELMIGPDPERMDIAVIVQAGLAAVGIDAQIVIREPAAMIPAVTGADRRYDAVIVGNVSDVVVNERDSWACDQVGQPYQFTSYCNPALDPILDSIPRIQDRGLLQRLIRRFAETIADDQPYTFLFDLDQIDVYRSLNGVELDARGDWVSVHDWWVHPDDRR